MHRRILITCMFMACVLTIRAQATHPFTLEQIGPGKAGVLNYETSTQAYQLKGHKGGLGTAADTCAFAGTRVSGDFLVSTDIPVQELTGEEAAAGLMIRSASAGPAFRVAGIVRASGMHEMWWCNQGMTAERQKFLKRKVRTIQLERKGNLAIVRMAPEGEPLQEVGRVSMSMPEELAVGFFVYAGGLEAGVKLLNLRVERLAHPGGKVSSRLEVMSLEDGSRKVVHMASGRFEAPNFMPDGKTLLFNMGGALFTLREQGGVPEKFNTGTVQRNNNDHGISFDQKLLAISSHRDGLPGGGSTIYTVPITGGEPRMVSDRTPNYWHGWSPDGRYVLAIGQRGGDVYNVYKINVQDGTEQNLTGITKDHVDGAEYSPDGKWIYYNWNVTGSMQIWRMRPDGSAKEQVTFDEYHNWFPHLSPDGKWILILSFLPDIHPDQHPPDQRVMLRVMPASGGNARVVANLYGGQGTINVPSWSPDSKRVAFVSYTY